MFREATPADLISSTGGSALVATGSPFPAVPTAAGRFKSPRATTSASSRASGWA